jgi:nitrite reductase/ring-hydroxylating ferredoxin subunit
MSKGGEEGAGFQRVANKKDIKEGSLLGVELEGNNIVLAMVNGQVYALIKVDLLKRVILKVTT